MTIDKLAYNAKRDYTETMNFFRETFNSQDTNQVWPPTRFENSIFDLEDINEDILLWRDTSFTPSKLAGISIISNQKHIEIFTFPEYNQIKEEILTHHEKKIKEIKSEETEIYVSCLEKDEDRKALLRKNGYQEYKIGEQPRIKIPKDIPERSIPNDYYITSFSEQTYKLQIEGVKTVFKHDKFTPVVYKSMREKASFYHPDLDLGMFTENGELAAFTMIRIDPVSKIAEFEPVATLPEHRRKGLAGALMVEGMKRAESKYKPSCYYIGAAATEQADRFYDSLGFTEKINVYYWKKRI